MLKYYFRTKNSNRLAELEELRDGVWINGENLDDDDINKIADVIGLDLIDLQDTLDPFELPRLERQDGAVILFLRNPGNPRELKKYAKQLHTESLTVIISPKYFITLSAGKNTIIQDMISREFNVATTQKNKMLLYVMLQTSQTFTKEIRQVRRDVLSQQKNIRDVVDRDIMDLVKKEEILNQYLSALSPIHRVFESIIREKILSFYEEDIDMMQDATIGVRQSVDLCTVSIKGIQSLRDSYQIIFTNRLNVTIRVLTILTVLLTIPNVFSSLYGMNVQLPGGGNPQAFWWIIVVITLSAGCFGWYFTKKLK